MYFCYCNLYVLASLCKSKQEGSLFTNFHHQLILPLFFQSEGISKVKPLNQYIFLYSFILLFQGTDDMIRCEFSDFQQEMWT